MDRREVARVLEEIAAMLELKGENPFKVRAYENGARAILGYSEDLLRAVETGELRRVQGIGAGLFSNVETLVRTGALPYYDELRAAFPPGLRECLRVPGLGARKAKQLHDALGIDSLEALDAACRDGRIASVPGFGVKTADKIRRGVAMLLSGAGRHRFARAEARAREVLQALEVTPGVARAAIAGSLRRRCETVRGADFVVECERPEELAAALPGLPGVAEGLPPEGGRLRALLVDGLLATVVPAAKQNFAPALLHATGSVSHVEALARRAELRGLRLGPDGLLEQTGERRTRTPRSEEEIYAALGLPFIEPELREGNGEIEAAAAGQLPRLVTAEDLQGIAHVHTTESDGRDSLSDMLAATLAGGYRWVAITDHRPRRTRAASRRSVSSPSARPSGRSGPGSPACGYFTEPRRTSLRTAPSTSATSSWADSTSSSRPCTRASVSRKKNRPGGSSAPCATPGSPFSGIRRDACCSPGRESPSTSRPCSTPRPSPAARSKSTARRIASTWTGDCAAPPSLAASFSRSVRTPIRRKSSATCDTASESPEKDGSPQKTPGTP